MHISAIVAVFGHKYACKDFSISNGSPTLREHLKNIKKISPCKHICKTSDTIASIFVLFYDQDCMHDYSLLYKMSPY